MLSASDGYETASSHSWTQTAETHLLSGIASDDLCKLTVVKSRNRQPSKVLPSVPTDFEWHVDPANAATYADQLSSLLLSDIPGHQYLDVQRGNYRTVVVTKLEYPVDTIRAMRDGRIPAAR